MYHTRKFTVQKDVHYCTVVRELYIPHRSVIGCWLRGQAVAGSNPAVGYLVSPFTKENYIGDLEKESALWDNRPVCNPYISLKNLVPSSYISCYIRTFVKSCRVLLALSHLMCACCTLPLMISFILNTPIEHSCKINVYDLFKF